MRRHTVFISELGREPSARCDAKESEVVSVLRQHRLRPHWVEVRFIVLDKIQLVLRTLEGPHRVRGVPASGYSELARRQVFLSEQHLRLQREEVLPNGIPCLASIVVHHRIANHDA